MTRCPGWKRRGGLVFGNMTHRLTLVPAIGRKAKELPLHRIDLGEIGGDEVIAAPLAGHHLKITACECCGGTGAAEMDEGSEILFLLRACRHVRCPCRKFDPVAG